MEAYRNDEITLEVLMAYTLSEDHQQQEALFDRLQGSWEADRPDAIRRALMEHAVSASDRRARLIGLDAYQAAGGRVRHDLFEEDCYLEDPALLDQLVMQRLAA